MTETSNPEGQPAAPAPDAAAPQGPTIRVLAQYVKDLSFENPNPLATANNQTAPAIELGIDVKAEPKQQQDKQLYEVDLRLSAQANRDDKVVFIAELIYSGLFELSGARQADVEPLLLIECPRLIFPFARRIVAEVTREGGYPPLLIDPIDFVGLYKAQKQAASQQPASDETQS